VIRNASGRAITTFSADDLRFGADCAHRGARRRCWRLRRDLLILTDEIGTKARSLRRGAVSRDSPFRSRLIRAASRRGRANRKPQEENK